MTLQATLSAQAALTPGDRQEMLDLMALHFDGLDPATFHRDLGEKHWVILLRDETGAIGGFSTLQALETSLRGRRHHVLFSGDTIVAPALRNQGALAGCFGHLVLRELDRVAPDTLHWLLISKGYRSYRFLPLNFHTFYPRFDAATPPDVEELMHRVASEKFGPRFQGGLVRATPATDRLKPELCAVPEGRAQDAHVRFFLERNPDFAEGHELVCLTPMSRENFTPMGWRQMDRVHPAWVPAPPGP